MAISNVASGLRPGVCTSTTRPSAPYTGQIIYETDTGYLRVWDGAAWDYFSQSQNDTTNLPISDIGTWTSFTPTWTNLTVGNATQDFKYTIVNKIMIVAGIITLGSTSSVGTIPQFTIPASKTAGISSMASAELVDSGTAYSGTIVASSTKIYFYSSYVLNTAWASRGNITATGPFTWGSGDSLVGTVVFQIT